MKKTLLFCLFLPICLFVSLSAQNVGIGTTNPINNLHINGNPLPNLNGNANATIGFGVPDFPGCVGHMGRFCRLDPVTLLPDGRYDLIRYMNAEFNLGIGKFEQIDPTFDVWIDGPCIANDPALTGFDIAYCPAGQTGPITPLTRLRINDLGNVGLGTPNPMGNLHVNGIPNPDLNNNANATMLFGPPQFPGCMGRFGRFCRLDPQTLLPDGRYDLIRYMNADFNPDIGKFEQVDPTFDVWIDGPCIANDPALTGFDIAYCPAGQTGPINPLTRLRINDLGNVGLGTPTPLGNLHVNGIPTVQLNNNANATMLFGPPQFPGCMGRFGRFCRLDPQTLLPDGRYDLIRYMNADFNPAIGQFEQVDPEFDVWIDGPCIANDPALTGFDIAYCPAGQTGPINPLTRLRINDLGNVGLGTPNPLGNLHVNGIPTAQLNNNANATMLFGPPQFPGCMGRFGRFCRLDPTTLLPDGRYDLIRYMNADINPANGQFQQIDPEFDVWIDGPCIANDPALTGFDIAYCPAGQTGPINPLTRLRINDVGNVGLGTPNPLGNLHVNGIQTAQLNNNANATMLFGPPQFPGCMGRFGRFCRLDPTTLLPDGRYDLIRYMNADINPANGQFQQIDPEFDVWIDGPCIANDPALSGFDIAYCPAGQTGPINPLTRLRINDVGNVGLGTPNPLGNLHVNGIQTDQLNNNANATMLFGPPQFPGCMGRFGRFCRLDPTTLLPDGRYDLIRYLNAEYNPLDGTFARIDPLFDVWIDGPCIANDPTKTGYQIAHANAGDAGTIEPEVFMVINGFGNMGIGTPTVDPGLKLQVQGIVQASGFLQLSDVNIKKNIKDITGSLNKVMDLRGVSFDYDPEAIAADVLEGKNIGFIAQEVEKIFPELVHEREDGIHIMNYTSLIPVLTEAITEQQDTIELLQKKIDAQDDEIARIYTLLMKQVETDQEYGKIIEQNATMQAEIDMLKAAILGSKEK